mgnify:CR=1 FL=1|jgi:aromatic-L-amino-acid decarboxylase
MTPDEFRARAHEVIDWIADYMRTVEDRPVLSQVKPGDISAMLPAQPPEHSEPWDRILGDLDTIVQPGLTHWQSPSFFGYFPANSSGPAILGDLVSSGLGVQGMLWSTSPACTEIETTMLDWLARMIGLPESMMSHGAGGGVLQGTASEAALVSLLAARAQRDHPDQPTVYCSSQAHSSIMKAAMISGLGKDAVRLIDVDESLRMDVPSLDRQLRSDVESGHSPLFVCATVGTTSSGAIDPVEQIAAVSQQHNCWLHVDAAWAGSACVCPEHRDLLNGVEAADSFNFNPHKWMLTTFDCSALWVRNRKPLLDALSIMPEYLRNQASETGAVIDYRDWQIPLGRRFRALKLWFVIRHYGVEGIRAHIRRGVELAQLFESLVRDDDRFELAAARSLGLVCFRLRGDDSANEELLAKINASGRAFFTHTRLPHPMNPSESQFVIRAAIGAIKTEERHIRSAWELIQTTAGAIQR